MAEGDNREGDRGRLEMKPTEKKPGLVGQKENRTTEKRQRVKRERKTSRKKKFGVEIESKSRW